MIAAVLRIYNLTPPLYEDIIAYRPSVFFSSLVGICSPNMLPDGTPRLLLEVFAKRDFGLAL